MKVAVPGLSQIQATKSLNRKQPKSKRASYVLLPFAWCFLPTLVQAQPIISADDSTNTQVTPSGSQFDITGGKLSGNGTNLFHSFSQFGLDQNQTANFIVNPSIQNVLSRVTGGDPSVINGLIQVTGGGTPNFYLMNPAGIIFGANATLNVPASFTATTANGIGLNGNWFSASGANDYTALNGNPDTLAFTMAQPGSIVNAGNLSVASGNNINLSLVGGTVASTGQVSAPGGQVTLAAVPGENFVRLSQAGQLLSLDIQPVSSSVSQPNNWTLPVVSLPQLLTGSGVGNATQLIENNGNVQLMGSGISVDAGDVVARNVTAQSATLSANNNLTLVESQLSTTGDLQLLAKDTVRIRDSDTQPVAAHAGGDLLIQGNQGIDILALNHPETPFQSGGDLSLVSDGIISGDAHFNSGGKFSILDLSAEPGTFVSLYDPIIKAEGDVNFGDYEGVSLKIETTGKITGGDITITGAEATGKISKFDPDFTKLTTGPALILRAGVQSLTGTNNVPSGITVSQNIASPGTIEIGSIFSSDKNKGLLVELSAPRNITVGSIGDTQQGKGDANSVTITSDRGNIQTGSIIISENSKGDGSDITLSAAEGAITVNGSLDTSEKGKGNAGSITLTSRNDITVNGSINTSDNSQGNGGNINLLTTQGTITTGDLNSSDKGKGSGGSITVSAQGTINVGDVNATKEKDGSSGAIAISNTDSGSNITTGSITGGSINISAQRLLRASGSIKTDGGAITITHGGGGLNIPFRVGAVSPNGTTGTVATGSGDSLPPGSYSGSVTQGSITLKTADPPVVAPSPVVTPPAPTTPDSTGTPPSTTGTPPSTTGTPSTSTGGSTVGVGRGTTGSSSTTNSPTTTSGGSPTTSSGSGTTSGGTTGSGNSSTSSGGSTTSSGSTTTSGGTTGSGNSSTSSGGSTTATGGDTTTTGGDTNSTQGNSSAELPVNSNSSSTSAELDLVSVFDEPFTRQFQEYFGKSTATSVKTLAEAREILQKVEQATGVKPALIYVTFVPQSASRQTTASTKALSKSDKPERLKQLIAQNTESPSAEQQPGKPQEENPDLRNTDQLELLVITAKGQPIRKRVPNTTRAQVLKIAGQFRSQVISLKRPNAYLAPAQQLYQWVIAPIKADLEAEEIKNLVFLMDTGLRSIPIAALQDGKKFLVEDYSVGLMPSLSLTDTRYHDLRNTEVLAMGAAKFANQKPLPAVPVELSVITPQLWEGKSFLNEAFTLKNLKSERAKTPFGIVHLATHAEFQIGSVDNSYIQLWDTRLKLNQLEQMGWSNPAVDLLVLSACRTALGDEKAELGFAGFAVQAGVKSALASLWYVSDEGTLGLMREFYGQLKTAPIKSEALRQAQIAMLQGQVQIKGNQMQTPAGNVSLPPELSAASNKDLSHPFYWAAFTMVGNPW